MIERVLLALETAAERVEQGQAVRPGFFLDGADFIKGFADGCHHHREEGVLFKEMAAAGMPQDAISRSLALMAGASRAHAEPEPSPLWWNSKSACGVNSEEPISLEIFVAFQSRDRLKSTAHQIKLPNPLIFQIAVGMRLVD